VSTVTSRSAAPGEERWRPVFEASVGAPIEVVETPTSWVILGTRLAYKLKKPLDIGEMRYSSPAQRRTACNDEVWLNRRLAEGVYLGVVPITRDDFGALRLGGHGDPVEWAIKMRRLPKDRNLRWLIDVNQLIPSQIASLAHRLAEFYRNSPPQTDQLDDLYVRLQRRVDDDRFLGVQFPPRLRQTIREIRAVQRDYLANARMVLNLRVCDGRVVDGHGDLRPDHVFFERQPAIIDCVEYSAQRRRCDALEDLSGLTMECRRLGRNDVAEALGAAYRRATGDDCFPHLEAFYRSMHACDRAGTVAAASARFADSTSRSHRLAEIRSYVEQAKSEVDFLS
jgi:aminoglycoside phosphotransferase family enzyme